MTQLVFLQRQCGLGDSAGIERIGLPNSAVSTGVDLWRLDDLVTGLGYGAGELGLQQQRSGRMRPTPVREEVTPVQHCDGQRTVDRAIS